MACSRFRAYASNSVTMCVCACVTAGAQKTGGKRTQIKNKLEELRRRSPGSNSPADKASPGPQGNMKVWPHCLRPGFEHCTCWALFPEAWSSGPRSCPSFPDYLLLMHMSSRFLSKADMLLLQHTLLWANFL